MQRAYYTDSCHKSRAFLGGDKKRFILELGCLDLCSCLLFTVLNCRVVTVSPATWLRCVNKELLSPWTGAARVLAQEGLWGRDPAAGPGPWAAGCLSLKKTGHMSCCSWDTHYLHCFVP